MTLLVVSTIASCSSDDSSTPVTPPVTETFSYTKDGSAVPITTWTAIKAENSIEVLGTNPDGRSIFVSFDKFGNLDSVGCTPEYKSAEEWKDNFYDFSSNYFNFSLISLNEATKTVTVTFSGKLYEDENDINSPFSEVSGGFTVRYTETAPSVSGIGTFAKIAGNDWHAVKGYTTSTGGSFSDITLVESSDDEYSIGISLNILSTATGTYNFTPTSANNKVVLSKFDTVTMLNIQYLCTGTFVLTDKTSIGGDMYLISGTFTLTAVNPMNSAQTIQVLNGTFLEVAS